MPHQFPLAINRPEYEDLLVTSYTQFLIMKNLKGAKKKEVPLHGIVDHINIHTIPDLTNVS